MSRRRSPTAGPAPNFALPSSSRDGRSIAASRPARITGTRSVDFLIEATGEGVINYNGVFPVVHPVAGRVVRNHRFPKLGGIDPLRRVAAVAGGEAKTLAFRLDNAALGEASLIVSAACIRAGIFREASFNVREVTLESAPRLLASLHGLVRGYLITKEGRGGFRKSPLHVTDFVCDDPGLFYDNGRDRHSRDPEGKGAKIFSHHATSGELRYRGKASLSVEDLAFIPLDNALGRAAFGKTTSQREGESLANALSEYLEDLAPADLREPPRARFVRARRRNSVEPLAEYGVLLDEAAVRVVAGEVRALIEGLTIRQGRGYLVVERVEVDYNDGRLFRAARGADLIVDDPSRSFARYYDVVPEPEDGEQGIS